MSGRRIAAVVAVAILFLAALPVAPLSWLSYADVFTSDPEERCARTYLETFDDGEVIEAKRVTFPPSIKCTLRYPPTGEVFITHRPHEPLADFAWAVGAHAVLIGISGFGLWRRRARRKSTELTPPAPIPSH